MDITTDKIKEVKDNFKDLRDRYDADYNLVTLEEYTLPDTSNPNKAFPNAVNITRNEPLVAFSHAMSKLLAVDPQWEVEGEKLNDKDTTNIEQFIADWLFTGDSLVSNKDIPSVYHWAAQQVLLRGRVAFGPFILPERKFRISPWSKRVAVPDIRLYDAYNLAYEYDTEGLCFAVYTQKRTKAMIENEYQITIDSTKAEVDVAWNREENVISIDGKIKKRQPNPYKEVPIVAKVVPRGLFLDNDDRIKNGGESIFWNNRGTYKNNNRMASILATITNRVLNQVMKHTSAGDTKPDPIQGNINAPGAKIPLKKGEELELLQLQDVNNATMAFIQTLDQDEQKGMFADVSYATDPGDHSAIAIKELRMGESSILLPCLECLESAFIDLMYMVIRQIVNQKLAIAVGRQGFEREYKYTELNKASFRIGMDLTSVDPIQDIANIQISNMAKEAGISKDTRMRDIIKVRNPDEEVRKVEIETLREADPVSDLIIRVHYMIDEYERTKQKKYDHMAKRLLARCEKMIEGEDAQAPQRPEEKGVVPQPNLLKALGATGRSAQQPSEVM